ncbi:MAG: ANTAR domain-containing protein [Propionibacteriaceae bacterium]
MSLDHVIQNPSRSARSSAAHLGRRDPLFDRLPGSPSAPRAGESSAEVLGELAALAARELPGVCGASVILAGADSLDFAGVSAPFVAELERAQQRLEQGPRIEAERNSDTLLSDALTLDPRWPVFAREIRELDLGSALVQLLVTPHGVLGTLALYGYGENAFDPPAVQLASTFAGPAALAARASTWAGAVSESSNGPNSVQSVGVIERALGIMMSRSACSQDRAILRLQKMSQAENQHLATMAQAVIDEALVESNASYVQVREPHRPFGRRAPAADPAGVESAGWGHVAQEPLS